MLQYAKHRIVYSGFEMPPRKHFYFVLMRVFGSSASYAASGERDGEIAGQETDDSVQAHNIKEHYDPGGRAV